MALLGLFLGFLEVRAPHAEGAEVEATGLDRRPRQEITLSTYYPSPRGVYNELQTRTLEVVGELRLRQGAVGAARPDCTPDRRGTLWFEHDVPLDKRFYDRLSFCAMVDSTLRWVAVSGQ